MKQALIILGLTAFTMAAPLKQRLAQAKSSDDGGAGTGVLDCSCELPGAPGAGFPAPGQAQYNNFGNGASVSQSSAVVTTPDTQWASQCESDCCACNVGTHASTAAATKLRTFTLGGSITVAETVEYAEAGNASEESVGHELKATACIVSNANNTAGAAPPQVCVCPDSGNGVSYQ